MIFMLVFIFIDQITKALIVNFKPSFLVIPDLLSITYTKNTGAIFGIFQDSNLFMIVISSFICLCLILFLIRNWKMKSFIKNCLFMILAGGVGNLIDRIFRGFVVDFIDTPFIATFNLADSFIVVGVVLLLIKIIFERNKEIE